MTLQPGDSVPHWQVTLPGGAAFRYASVWQRRNLVLVTIPPSFDASGYIDAFTAREAEFRDRNCASVITRDDVRGLPGPAALVADRWGEIVQVWVASAINDLPTAAQLLDWVEFVEHRCPECEGESR